MSGFTSIIPMSDSSSAIQRSDVSPTVLPDLFLNSDEATQARKFHLPSYHQLPDMRLYRDQVVAYAVQQMRPLAADSDDAWLTPSMVNNYVKMRLIPAPEKKQYGREHLARLIAICVFKQFLSMAAIEQLLRIQQMSYPLDVAYDYVADELNEAVAHAFDPADELSEPEAKKAATRETMLVRAAAKAFASKAYLMAYLHFAGFENEVGKR